MTEADDIVIGAGSAGCVGGNRADDDTWAHRGCPELELRRGPFFPPLGVLRWKALRSLVTGRGALTTGIINTPSSKIGEKGAAMNLEDAR